MQEISERIDRLSPRKREYFVARLMEQNNLKEQVELESIAIIGMGCRFPRSCDNPDAFWNLLRSGIDAITEIPLDRWDADAYYDPEPAVPGKMNTRWGGFLRSIDEFDANFFRISPREANSMDPQQRLVLEVSWEALEDAGQSADDLIGSETGVFLGIGRNDYSQIHGISEDPKRIDPYFGTGNAFSFLTGRLSYLLGLRGPSVSIDTACSSSLVAIHLACMSLRARECNLVLAGGVNVILSPHVNIYLSQLRTFAADGRCKTFDARADGYVRAEGCGVIVLKRLSDALRDNDNIIGLIRGSAVNHDGRSAGLTAPNGPAQEAVMRKALSNAGIKPYHVDYVEAHGTGTSLGDPIEIGALTSVLRGGGEVHLLTNC